MKQFITSLGWKYSHNCGCSPQMGIYYHDEIKGFVIWVRPDETVMKIRRGDVRDSKDVCPPLGKHNYQQGYEHYIVNRLQIS